MNSCNPSSSSWGIEESRRASIPRTGRQLSLDTWKDTLRCITTTMNMAATVAPLRAVALLKAIVFGVCGGARTRGGSDVLR